MTIGTNNVFEVGCGILSLSKYTGKRVEDVPEYMSADRKQGTYPQAY